MSRRRGEDRDMIGLRELECSELGVDASSQQDMSGIARSFGFSKNTLFRVEMKSVPIRHHATRLKFGSLDDLMTGVPLRIVIERRQ